MKSGSRLERILKAGHFAVTGELGPPKSSDPEVVREKARILKGHVDAVNITDCQTAIVRMSSISAGLITLQEGVEPVIQMTCRDRNRIGMQSDILGASALGLKNLLCLTGDHQKFGNHPGSKGVFDMDSIQMLGMMKTMRDDKEFQCGEAIKSGAPKVFLGCAANPFAYPFEFRAKRLGKKVTQGADFCQTQIIYNVEKFAEFMKMVRDLGIHEKCHILAGVTPPKSLGMARYMKKFVPGMEVTDEVIQRLQDAKDKQEEGIQICVDIINQIKEIEGVAGAHIMAIEWEEAVPEIVSRAGLSDRPVLDDDDTASTTEKVNETIEVTSAPVDTAKADAILAEANAKAKQIVATAQAEADKLDQAKAHAVRLIEDAKTTQTTAPTDNNTVNNDTDAGEHEMNEQERLLALESVTNGLNALKAAFNLTDEQFDALSSFAGAQSILGKDPKVTSSGSASAPVTPVATVSTPAEVEKPVPVAASTTERIPRTPQTAEGLPSEVVKRYEVLLERAGGTTPSGSNDTPSDDGKAKAEAAAKAEAEAKEKAEAQAKKESEAKAKVVEKPAAPAAKAPEKAKAAAPVSGDTARFSVETTSLADRASKVPTTAYTAQYTGAIRETTLGNGDNTITVGGESTLPFQIFEGSMDNKPRIAMEVVDSGTDAWPETLTRHFADVLDNPVAWAQKCVGDFGADAICVSLTSTDPNGLDKPSDEAAKVAASVVDAVDVPVIVWGCENGDKDTDTLRELTSLIGEKKVCLAPLSDANYRSLGATAMAFQHPIVAASPIDVNLAKQLNILMENLGVNLDNVMIDPSIGALGYGIEYTYSVMERIRQAALVQQDEKLQVPIICNLGREVWKAKECRLPTDELLGDQETRSLMMEAITASCMLMAGGELMIMRHPKAVSLTRAMINGLMA